MIRSFGDQIVPFIKVLCFISFLISEVVFATELSNLPVYADKGADCEIMYASHPHHKATVAIGSERLKKTTSLSYEETERFSKVFISLTDDIINSLIKPSSKDITIKGQELILGGYEGETVTSVVIKTTVYNDVGQKTLLKLAAHIGYVYAQDSTLVICSDNANITSDNWTRLTSIEIQDQGEELFFQEKNIPIFFGMMIGSNNSPENLGFTFYKDSKVFSTLASSEKGKVELALLEKLSDWINELSGGDVKLGISSKDTWVFFPHNDWQNNPLGKAYKNYMEIESIKGLDLKREQFLKGIDDFMLQK